MCPFIPRILLTNSSRKPFITDITIIKVATPKAIPINENHVDKDIKPSVFFDLKYLKATYNSKDLNDIKIEPYFY
tara:strand:- start:1079 stop:1303 length:225 start_codon:yes stop_codon:yes gene_type:complete